MQEKEDEQGNKINNAEDVDPTKVPETVIKEKDDQPAANNMKRTIILAIVVLVIFYLIYEYVLKSQ
ncbi:MULTISPECIES: hypothetical protein [Sphingobacterium]|uniref:Uncharacterized protein n=1 Tax=Sphingobacterium cellulitidis TaxID=1768011 RepID=A0A8H9FXD4_9SPHI|nr:MULTISPECIES: hypothetical protein [Sphingobacterium]MBA8986897.1 hypothetical protein [Sphingobacterium soli]OYD42198.1 hypothetical protein CHT99_09815 [Sphingobacterium cellulitidis]OYD45355.1 hypothetical protein CHU00_11965 [Sphingobacterium cellulitidis]WFB64895.1 hypothetical protein PZ892_06715 [Sphingobacterium sp. WM]GGE14782.1 hypothetical protein GCM10011516_10740 [Sphingobacterium soli]